MSKKIVIIGGVAGGASAAARLRRLDEDAEIILFERGPFLWRAVLNQVALIPVQRGRVH